MKVRINRILSYLIAILIITSTCIFNIPIINNTSVLASEITEKGFTINDAIYGLIYYYDNEYYNNSKSNKTLEGLEYAAMYKANADLTKKNWSTNETIKTYGISGKAKQSIILMELDINPINYKGENLIEQVVEDLNKTTSIKFIQNILQEVLAVEMFNEKFPEQKIIYNIKNIIDLMLKEQDESGCIGGAIHNTAYAIEIFNKYSYIDGVLEGKEKGINYLKSQIKDKGVLYKDGGTYFTYIHAQAVRALLQAGEDVTSEKWSKDGYNIVDGLFYEWNGENFIDKYGKDRAINHYTEVLYTLSKLNDLGYKDVFLKNVEFLNVVKDDTNQSKDEKVTINKVIDGVIDYYNEKHFVEEQGQLSDFHYSAMYRAGANLSEKIGI